MTEEKCIMFALGEFLSEFPNNKNSDEILDLLEADDESIVVWEPYEKYPVSQVISMITSLAHNVKQFVESEK